MLKEANFLNVNVGIFVSFLLVKGPKWRKIPLLDPCHLKSQVTSLKPVSSHQNSLQPWNLFLWFYCTLFST